MAGEWRISAEERNRYETYFQQCAPVQGYISGDKAREFFVKSGLPSDVLKKIWDLADMTNDGRLDKREFSIACHFIASQVQKKAPLPATLPPTLLSDAMFINTNGTTPSMPLIPLNVPRSLSVSMVPTPFTTTNLLLKASNTSLPPITPANRSKHLQQFHSVVDVTKTNGFMSGTQARNILQQTNLSQTILRQIWDLADQDKDGRLTADEFVIAMHCCDVARAGHILPTRLPDDWLNTNPNQHERSNSFTKSPFSSILIPDPLKALTNENFPPEPLERKNSVTTYEDKRKQNYEDGYRELERRRQLLREQEERDQRERAERDQRRELELQRQKEEQDRRKQLEYERQLERQRQIEQHREEERKKLLEQREAARKELERKNRLDWERQRMQELSSQKSRLSEQINDIKSRSKGLDLEIQSMDETIQTRQMKLQQTTKSIETIDRTLNDLEKRIIQERTAFQMLEQQRKDLLMKLNRIKAEREPFESSRKQMDQSKEFTTHQRDAEQMRFLQAQVESIKHEQTRIDQQIIFTLNQTKQYHNQMEQLRSQLAQLEQQAKKKSTQKQQVSLPTVNHDSFYTNTAPNYLNAQSSFAPSALVADPFQTVDPFATAPTELASPSSNLPGNSAGDDPFRSTVAPAIVKSPPTKKPAPKAKVPSVDRGPWGESKATNGTNNGWKPSFHSSPSQDSTSSNVIQYRAIYDYAPERADELRMAAGDIITVDPNVGQQDDNWLFGRTTNGKEGYFPANYTERIELATPQVVAKPAVLPDTTSTLTAGTWVVALAEYQGKTPDKHLSFQKGDLIFVQTQRDTTWYSGKLREKVGWFPRNYVRPATETEIPPEKIIPSTPTINPPTSLNGSSKNESSIVWRQRPDLPTIPEIYEAIYAYEATDPADLSFNVGDRITVLQTDGDWWQGRIEDRTGMFPNNRVRKVENPLQETAVAIAPFYTNEEGRLSFDQGQMIYIRKKGDKGWYQGEIRNSDQPIRVGWFPANCVQVSMNNSSIIGTPSYLNTTPEYPRYKSIFPYEAQHDDELSFPADVIFEILDLPDNTSGWFKARLGQQVGLVPSTYVQAVDEINPSPSPRVIMRPTNNHLSLQPEAVYFNTTSSDCDTSASVETSQLSSSTTTNTSRISAVRELIETEQRYIDDLQIVTREFIQPVIQKNLLSPQEYEELFMNWQNLIQLNSILLQALKERVDYKESSPNQNGTNGDPLTRASRSVSMTNIAMAVQMPSKSVIDHRHRSFTPDVSQSPSVRRIKHRNGSHHRSPSNAAFVVKPMLNVESNNDSNHQLSPSSSMMINDSTEVGRILCDHLPMMGDDYFQYCNSRSQANKCLQMKIDGNEQFRSCLQIFQDKTGGLSLNGFLTKPIQRVTRYPLLIGKILKHTPEDHLDYQWIKQASDCARQLNERINTQISEQENTARLDWLQQHLTYGSDDNGSDGYIFDELLRFNSVTKYQQQRQLIHYGLVMKMPSGKELLAFLFNDFFLFSTMKSSSSQWQTQIFDSKSNLQLKLYRMPIFLTDIIIANDALNDQLTFSITTKIYDKPVQLKTQQTNVRTLWVKSINTAVEECQAAERSILSDKALYTIPDNKRDTKTAVARLLLVIQEAHDLMPLTSTLERHRSVDPYCEVTIGPLTLRTAFIKRSVKPKWNAPMQFLLYNLTEDVITINIYDHEYFSPNESLGSTSIHLVDILPCPLEQFLLQPSLPFTQKIFLNNGSSVVMKFVVQLLPASQST